MSKEVRISTEGIDKLLKILRQGQFGAGPIYDMFRQWTARYSAFVRRRFVKFSRGGGDWKPLKASTIRARRGPIRRRTRSSRARTKTTTRGSAGTVAILRDTGTLFKALTIGAPGNLHVRIKNGVRYGFGGPARYTRRGRRKKAGGQATISDIGVFHNSGAGRNPKRLILAEPDARTLAAMKRDTTAAVDRIGKMAEIRR